jgi:hypothetical protein
MKKLRYLISIIAAFGVAAFFVFGIYENAAALKYDRASRAESEILAAINLCMAVEGVYPPGIDYLARNYHLNMDRGRFNYMYEADGAGGIPSFGVTPR